MTNRNSNNDDQYTVSQSCAAVRDLLPGYITQEFLGQDPLRADPAVAQHCAGCDDCRAVLQELRELLADDGPRRQPPPFNLFFLRPARPHAALPAWQINPPGRLVFDAAQAIRQRSGQPTFAGAARGQSLYSFDLKLDPPHGFNVLIKILQSTPQAEQEQRLVDVEVCVEVMDADPLDQSGSQVVIATDTLHRRSATNRSGLARFSGLGLHDLSELRIEVQPRSDTTLAP